MKLYDSYNKKILISENYNFIFDKITGFFVRWGKNRSEDVDPKNGLLELADIEISTICNNNCAFCYKNNTSKGTYMSIDTFQKVFSKLPRTLTQIAFGIGNIDSNPDLWEIFQFCRLKGVIPNITINGYNMSDKYYDMLAGLCGAVAVSYYDKNVCYDAVYELTKRKKLQTNIHYMISENTYDELFKVFNDIKKDKRLKKLNSIVLLSLKQKGRAIKGFEPISNEKFYNIIKIADEMKIRLGFDSCSAPKAIYSYNKINKYDFVKDFIEPCESSVFSVFINVKGEAFPCSFIEKTEGWKNGIDVLKCKNFSTVWNSIKFKNFRKDVINCRNKCKACPTFNV